MLTIVAGASCASSNTLNDDDGMGLHATTKFMNLMNDEFGIINAGIAAKSIDKKF